MLEAHCISLKFGNAYRSIRMIIILKYLIHHIFQHPQYSNKSIHILIFQWNIIYSISLSRKPGILMMPLHAAAHRCISLHFAVYRCTSQRFTISSVLAKIIEIQQVSLNCWDVERLIRILEILKYLIPSYIPTYSIFQKVHKYSNTLVKYQSFPLIYQEHQGFQ